MGHLYSLCALHSKLGQGSKAALDRRSNGETEMTQEIKLPPLPTITVDGKEYKQVWFTAHEVEKLRVAAIDAAITAMEKQK